MVRYKLTIRLKVLLALGLLLVVALALGIFAMDRLSRVNAAASEISSTAPKVRRCGAGISSAAIGNGEETAKPPPNPVNRRTTIS